jgi:hypothetical protein
VDEVFNRGFNPVNHDCCFIARLVNREERKQHACAAVLEIYKNVRSAVGYS